MIELHYYKKVSVFFLKKKDYLFILLFLFSNYYFIFIF